MQFAKDLLISVIEKEEVCATDRKPNQARASAKPVYCRSNPAMGTLVQSRSIACEEPVQSLVHRLYTVCTPSVHHLYTIRTPCIRARL